jgi:hypothetical protein
LPKSLKSKSIAERKKERKKKKPLVTKFLINTISLYLPRRVKAAIPIGGAKKDESAKDK